MIYKKEILKLTNFQKIAILLQETATIKTELLAKGGGGGKKQNLTPPLSYYNYKSILQTGKSISVSASLFT